ncbi:hypothetical protein JCM15415_16920 [Methanobacterium movens]
MKKEEIYRDTEDWYLKTKKNQAYSLLVDLTSSYAGNKILDIGCATGSYCIELKKKGFKCVGVDINEGYVEDAIEKGVEAYKMNAEKLIFPDNSFDTIILFEVLEHSTNPKLILNEARRVSKKNILISVPNSTNFFELKRNNLTYEHMLETDHLNFFTKNDLEELLSEIFEKFKVEEIDPIPLTVGLPNWVNYVLIVLIKLKLIKYDRIYNRLISVIEV